MYSKIIKHEKIKNDKISEYRGKVTKIDVVKILHFPGGPILENAVVKYIDKQRREMELQCLSTGAVPGVSSTCFS